MGGTQSSETTVEKKLETVIENRCGSVVCRNVQNATFEVGAGGKISGVKAKQRCSAKLACAFDSIATDKVEADISKKQGAGAGTTGTQESKTKLKESISKKVLNDCGSAMSEQQQNMMFKGGAGSEISSIELDQSGDAALECAAKTLLSTDSKTKIEEDQKQAGLMDGLNALLGSIGMIPLIIGAVIIVALLFAPQVFSMFAGPSAPVAAAAAVV